MFPPIVEGQHRGIQYQGQWGAIKLPVWGCNLCYWLYVGSTVFYLSVLLIFYAAVEMARAMVNMELIQAPRAYPSDLLKAKPEFR